MSTVRQLTYFGAAVVDSQDRFFHTGYHQGYSEAGTYISQSAGRYFLVLRFPEIPAAIRYKKLLNVKIRLNANKSAAETRFLYFYPLSANIDPETVTWDTAPGITVDSTPRWGYYFMSSSWQNEYRIIDAPSSYLDSGTSYTDAINIARISKNALASNSIAIEPNSNGAYWFKDAPMMLVEVDESVTITSQIAAVNSPTSGWINPASAQTFSWEFTYSGDYPCPGNFEQQAAIFHWRSGTSGNWTDVPAASASVTIPANTFPGGTIQWYVSGTDTQGTSSQTPVYTVTTEDSEAIATAVEPSGTVEDGSAPILFKWTVSNSTGSTPTGADLQYSADDSTWSALAHVSGPDTEYAAPQNTFPAGLVYWRVRAYNRDGVAGAWSASKQFLSFAAPAAPIVTAEAVPFSTISWQSEGQQAYRITVDGTVYGPFFGSAKSYTLEDYLENGSHTAAVEIQGSSGLWSKPGTVTFSVLNVPGAPIQLTGVFYRDAQLRWATISETADFLVYRDGVRIAHTFGSDFSDRTVLGVHSWQVINRLPGGMYTASNAVQGELKSCGTAMALLAGGEWLELRKTDSENSEQSIAVSQQISLRHFEGGVYPEPEVSPYIDQTGSYLVAWTYGEQVEAAAFEAMMGRPVILKARGNECTIGIVTGYNKRLPRFYKAYSFNVQRIHWEDFIDEDD